MVHGRFSISYRSHGICFGFLRLSVETSQHAKLKGKGVCFNSPNIGNTYATVTITGILNFDTCPSIEQTTKHWNVSALGCTHQGALFLMAVDSSTTRHQKLEHICITTPVFLGKPAHKNLLTVAQAEAVEVISIVLKSQSSFLNCSIRDAATSQISFVEARTLKSFTPVIESFQ